MRIFCSFKAKRSMILLAKLHNKYMKSDLAEKRCQTAYVKCYVVKAIMTCFFCASAISTHAFSLEPETCDDGHPLIALQRNLEGSVLLKFDISAEGKPVNIRVLKSNPEKIFDNSAICALSKWTYKPKVVDGVAVIQKNLKVQLDFKLDEERK